MKTLTENGYKEWQRDADRVGVEIQYQKRIDTVPEYEDYPYVGVMISYSST